MPSKICDKEDSTASLGDSPELSVQGSPCDRVSICHDFSCGGPSGSPPRFGGRGTCTSGSSVRHISWRTVRKSSPPFELKAPVTFSQMTISGYRPLVAPRISLIILIASLMHQSALLVIPFIFIAQGKAWNKKTLLFMVAVIAIVAGIGQFTNVLDSMLAETQYKNVVSDWQSWNDNGTNALRVLVYAVPSVLSLIGLRFIRNEDDKVINLCTNMSIVSVGFYIVSMFTSGIFIGRLPIYFSLYSYILLPWEIDHMFTKRSARLIYVVMVVGYLGFYLYSVNNLLG